jgi:hypothetical protein
LARELPREVIHVAPLSTRTVKLAGTVAAPEELRYSVVPSCNHRDPFEMLVAPEPTVRFTRPAPVRLTVKPPRSIVAGMVKEIPSLAVPAAAFQVWFAEAAKLLAIASAPAPVD